MGSVCYSLLATARVRAREGIVSNIVSAIQLLFTTSACPAFQPSKERQPREGGMSTRTYMCHIYAVYAALSSSVSVLPVLNPPGEHACQYVAGNSHKTANSEGINHDLTTMRLLTYSCSVTRGEWYHCFKRPSGGGAGAGASQACSLVMGPYNRAASALPLTSQLGGPPPPSSLIAPPPSVSFICRGPPAPEPSLCPAYRPDSHTALPRHRLTAALSSACQAYANKALSIQRALECQLSLCFLPFPLFFLSLTSVCLYFAPYLAYSSSLTCYFLSICLSPASFPFFFTFDFASSFLVVSMHLPLVGHLRNMESSSSLLSHKRSLQ